MIRRDDRLPIRIAYFTVLFYTVFIDKTLIKPKTNPKLTDYKLICEGSVWEGEAL